MTVVTGSRDIAVFTDESPIDRYLAEQADLTAVERFAQRHDAGLVPRRGRHYRDLVPLRSPLPGEQYGFEVDLDACTGCKACVTACRSLNGLDGDESWRSVGLLHGGASGAPSRQTVTTACHHCVDPACLNGCPAKAYDKDPVTGVVKHLDDHCIGCGYCTLTCPYDVPVYNPRLGIVRKCDMCHGRLAAGEAPACVQACPNQAISIALVDTAAAVRSSRGAQLVPGAPPSSITVPTTVYRTKRAAGDLVAADHHASRPADAHPPLAVMLVLTQLSVGAFTADLALRTLAGARLAATLRPFNAAAALGLGLLALGASVFHLGRPRYAFRAVLGIRRSWLSREIVAFGAFACLATAYAGVVWLQPPAANRLEPALGGVVAFTGVVGVACSVMVYAVTRRRWWRARTTGPKFALTGAVCGLAAVLFTSLASSHLLGRVAAAQTATDVAVPLAVLLAAGTAVKLAWEACLFRHLLARRDTDLKRTATLLSGDLAASSWWRFALGLCGGVAVPAVIVATAPAALLCTIAAGAGVAAVVAGELVERSQFFVAVSSPRMPGEIA